MMQEITVQNGQPAPELTHDIMKHKACGIRQEYSCYICLDDRKQKSKNKNQETQETIVDQFSFFFIFRLCIPVEIFENFNCAPH